MLNGHDEVSPIILTMEATTTVGDKIRFMVRPTVIRIQVKWTTKAYTIVRHRPHAKAWSSPSSERLKCEGSELFGKE